MRKTILINIETQTEDNDVISLCHVNEKTISLEVSNIARIMFRKNRALFDKINNSTKLIGGALYRQEVDRPKENTNRLYTNFLNSYEYVEKEISQLYFENNILKKQQRAISKGGKKFDFDPSLVSDENAGGSFDEKKLSPDDISESQRICSIEEINLFQDMGVKTFLITDFMEDVRDIIEVGYRIELSVENEFREYVDFVLSQAKEAIFFLESYLESLESGLNYDVKREKFFDDYTSRTLNDLGLDTSGESPLDTERIKRSNFGKASLSFFNLYSLLTSKAEGSLYSDVLRIILPSPKTTPQAISKFISDFKMVHGVASREYLPNNSQDKKQSNKFSRISEGKVFKSSISATTMERFALEQEKLGYSLFSDEQKGLNKFSSEDYKRRYALEQAKYYPNIDVADSSKFLTPSEMSEFSRMDNAPAFLTPSSLIMGGERIKTNRGMNNIPINKVREFRLAKSSRAQQNRASFRPVSYSKAMIGQDVISSFNITIARPRTALLERSTEEQVDPLVDAKHYVGEGSLFISNNPLELKKQFKRMMTREDSRVLGIISDVVPRRFLRNNRAINSIKEIQFSNPNSRVRKMANSKELRINEIPPHVKFMMSKGFNPNENSDPMKNSESREIIEETQKNLFLVKALVGFEKDKFGFSNIADPIYKEIDMTVLSSGRPILAKAFDYEIPELGIVKDNFTATIYNNLIYIRG